MRDIEYMEPSSLPEALAVLDERGDDLKVLAGGQSLLLMLHLGLVQPGLLMSLQRLPTLAEITYAPDTGLRIGAMTTQRAIETSSLVRQHVPTLAYTSSLIASVHVRALGTLGGNLCHNLPGADPPPTLIALNAEVTLARARETRVLPVAELFQGFMETSVEADELLTEIRIPPRPAETSTVYLKHCVRVVDPALVGVAVSLGLADEGRTCRDLRIGVGGVSHTPYQALEAERVLRGERLTSESIAAAAATAAATCEPMSDAHGSARYRQKMLEVFVRRALTQAWRGTSTEAGGSDR